jgi:hypothetical protein
MARTRLIRLTRRAQAALDASLDAGAVAKQGGEGVSEGVEDVRFRYNPAADVLAVEGNDDDVLYCQAERECAIRFGLRGPSATTRLQRCRSCDKAVARSPHCALMRPFGTLRGDHSRAYFTTGTPAIQKRPPPPTATHRRPV